MDFTITSEQVRLVHDIEEFARTELSARAAHSDREGELDRDAWRRCAERGLLGLPVPARWGGAGHDAITCVLALEALGYGCRDNGLVFAVNNHLWACTSYLLAHGSPEQQARHLPALASGSVIGAQALTEPETGSDVLSLSTTARREGETYVLDGVKTFISNAPDAGLFVLFARTADDGPAQRRLSAFLVPRDVPGLRPARRWDKCGLRGAPMGELVLRDVRLGPEHLLGAEGAGYQIFTSTIEWERGFMFAGAVGALRRIMEQAVGHANARFQFGRSIGSFQAVSHKIADMRVRLELARLMLYRFGWLRAQNRVALLESSMLKLHVSEALVAGALDGMQINGARGFLTDFGVEGEVRDALGTTLYAGTSEIHRTIIARLSGVHDAG